MPQINVYRTDIRRLLPMMFIDTKDLLLSYYSAKMKSLFEFLGYNVFACIVQVTGKMKE